MHEALGDMRYRMGSWTGGGVLPGGSPVASDRGGAPF
jgi:hypothetical protein